MIGNFDNLFFRNYGRNRWLLVILTVLQKVLTSERNQLGHAGDLRYVWNLVVQLTVDSDEVVLDLLVRFFHLLT